MSIRLNSEQKKAANTLEGNLLIIASAGTGKTTTIVERYVNFIEKAGFHPEEIMMTTFTNRAAKDMIKKISSRTRRVSPYIGTMHSLFLKILRDNPKEAFGNKIYTIITDTSEQKKIVKGILDSEGIISNADAVSYFTRWIGKFKNRGILAENLDWNGGIDEAVETGQITELLDDEIIYIDRSFRSKVNLVYKKYQEFLHKHNLLDFDEILILTYRLFSDNPEILTRYRNLFKAIMVDEAQDLNVVQVKILELLRNNNLCLIGDDCQNIYEWRGSSNDLIFDFERNEERIFLSENYRSTKEIINGVNSIIDSMENKIDKKLVPTRDSGTKVDVRVFDYSSEETDFIISEIERLISEGEKLDSIAVLFRTNFIGKNLERSFRRREIPCHLAKSVDFFSREEIKDILSFLKLSVNPNSALDFERTVSLVKGFGKAKVTKVFDYAYSRKVSFVEALKDLFSDMSEVMKLIGALKNEAPLTEFLEVFDYFGYIENRYSNEPHKIDDKLENISVLVDLFDKRDSNVSLFLDSLMDIDKKEKTEDKVVLTTIHGAKGLEWKYVFLVYCNEKTLPFYKGELTKAKRDSELRLFYVAVSRAKDNIMITSSFRDGYSFSRPSQFIEILGNLESL